MDNSDDLAYFRDWLSDRIRDKQWTQAHFAELVGVTPAQVSHVLSGERRPGVRFLQGVADALEEDRVVVFRLAGMMDTQMQLQAMDDDAVRTIRRLLNMLTREERERAGRMVIQMLRQYTRDHPSPKATAEPEDT